MKAIVWDGSDYPGSLSYQDFPDQKPNPGWALVNTKAVGICGSDVHLLLGHWDYMVPASNLPAVLGHENAGVVVEVGEGVTRVKPGDRVAVEPLHGCIQFGNSCPMCRIGKYQLCQFGLTILGLPFTRMMPGGYGEYSLVHESRLFPMPATMSFEEAALLDVLGCAVHATSLGGPEFGKSAVVMGCGVIGLDIIQCLRNKGLTDIIAVAKYDFQAEYARRMGAKETIVLRDGIDPVAEVKKLTAGWGVDLAYECVGGETDALDQCVRMTCFSGNVVMLGGPATPRPIDMQYILRKEGNILSSNSYSTAGARREYQIALDMLSEGKVEHKSLISYRFAPEEYRKAFETAIDKGNYHAFKIQFIRE